MQSDRVHLHRVSADGLEQVIREVTELARRKGAVSEAYEAARLRSVVEFLLRPSLVQVRKLAAMGSAYADPIPKAHRPKARCPKCDGWLTLAPKQGGFIYPTHKVSTHAGRCELSGRPATCLSCKKASPRDCDQFCQACIDELTAAPPADGEEPPPDPYWGAG